MRTPLFAFAAALIVCITAHAQDRAGWRAHVPADDKSRTNPLTSATDVAAGNRLYLQHCARCHGGHLEGTGHKPGLVGPDTTTASDGELFWLLRNGDIMHGMPQWTVLPEPERWQIISFVRSMAVTPAETPASKGTSK